MYCPAHMLRGETTIHDCSLTRILSGLAPVLKAGTLVRLPLHLVASTRRWATFRALVKIVRDRGPAVESTSLVAAVVVTVLAYLHVLAAMGWLGGAILVVSSIVPGLRSLSPAASL